ncbi:hypothetical protein A2U01_0105864, partial [Trifolium medium]|nr:hypothetical protein [Trifolium medium]
SELLATQVREFQGLWQAIARDGDALAQRSYSSLSDASPDLKLSPRKWPWSRPNSISTTFDP